MKDNILQELSFLTSDQIKTDAESFETYGKDWTRYYKVQPQVILFPKTTEEVQKIVQWANDSEVPLVPSGGRTGLSGAAVARKNEAVVCMDKMNEILEFNEVEKSVIVEAGVITEDLQNYIKEKGYYFPVDFAARGSSQIGGNVATNAGGLNVIRYGLMRDWVLGLEVVTGAGEILNLNKGLVKNATGYDFRHLFIGSEGTLGFVTKVTLKVTDKPKQSSVFILGLNNQSFIKSIYVEFSKKTLNAFEFFTDEALEYVMQAHGMSAPLNERYALYLLIDMETACEEDLVEALNIFESCMESGWIDDGVMSQSSQQAESFWKYRDFISESISPRTPYKNDVSVRISQIPEFMDKAAHLLKQKYPHFEVIWFGHVGDGNIHINILKPKDLEVSEFIKTCQAVDQDLFALIDEFSGSISAEHGVGLSKKPFLKYTRSAVEIELMKSIKKAFDPKGILNPGKIFD